MSLENRINNPREWGNNIVHPPRQQVIASGFDALDQQLAGGFPLGALTELLTDSQDNDAMHLVLHSLAKLSPQGRWIALIAPPHLPDAPMLARHGIDLSRILLVHSQSNEDTLRAMEQALQAGTCSAVLAWPTSANERQLRRLQLAAERSNAMAVLLHTRQNEKRSPAALRLKLRPSITGTQVDILKRRGGWPCGPVQLDWNPEPHSSCQPSAIAWL